MGKLRSGAYLHPGARTPRSGASARGRARPGTRAPLVAAALALGLVSPRGARAAGLDAPRKLALRGAVAGAPGATVEQRPVVLHGLPVRGAFETVAHEGDTARVVARRAPTFAPDLRPEQARISAADLPTRVQAELDLAAPPRFEAAPKLVYVDILGHPVLAWEVTLALALQPEPTRKTLWLGAAGGHVLEEKENVFSSKARIFAQNPAATPVPVEVELSGIDAKGPGVPLESETIRTYNCTLQEPDDVEGLPPWYDEGECFPVQRTVSDADGNFFVPMPDVKFIDQNLEGDDLYPELAMYVHSEIFFDAMEARGVEGFRCALSTMLANFRYTEPSVSYPELPFGPLNNAYYTDVCDPDQGTTMLFGQGSAIDFGFDGDVIYHELGHGITSYLSPDGLWGSRMRADGYLRDARGINEAVADYLSAMVTGDPNLADYVGRYWPSYTRAYIRTLLNQKRCPDNTIGQEHNDGEPFGAALWAARRRIGPAMDEVVLRTLPRLPGDVDLETASAAVAEVAAEMADEGALTEGDLDVLHRVFDARGLFDCPRVVTDPEDVASGHTMWLRRQSSSVHPFLPGPIQLRHEIPEGSDNMIVTFRLTQRGTSTGNPLEDPVAARVLVKYDDSPIEFQYDLVAELPEDDAKETIFVTGDWDEEFVPQDLTETERQLIVRGLPQGQVVHVSLVNDSAKVDAIASSVAIVSVPSDELDQGTPGAPGPDDDMPGATGGAVDEQLGEASTSCACRGGAGPRGAATALPLLLLVAGRRRRR